MCSARIAIQTEALCKAFGNRTVLRHIDLRVAEGESVALTGANGSGKTTLLRCLGALLRPTAGHVMWFGRRAGTSAADRRLIGVVAHGSLLYSHLTLRENLIFAARMCNLDRPVQRADRLLRDVGLHRHAHRLPSRISQGMRRRLAVVRALIHDPPILLLDEPFSGLDTTATGWLLELLLEFRRRGRTLCFAVHDEEKVRLLAHRVLYLQLGRLEETRREERPDDSPCFGSSRAA